MCRLLSYVSATPTTSDSLLGASECETWQRMANLHTDGWGTAWVADGAVRRYRDPLTGAGSKDLTGALTDTPSIARITHLRLATEGIGNQRSNTHPFRAEGVAFMHNGSVRPVAELRAMVDPAEIEPIGGTTDSAIVFALILRRRREGATLFEATTSVVAELRERFPESALNIMLLDPTQLIVVNANEGAPLPHDEFEARGVSDKLPRDHDDEYYRLSYRRTPTSIAFSSSGLQTDGWTHLGQHEAVRVDLATLATEFVSIAGRNQLSAA